MRRFARIAAERQLTPSLSSLFSCLLRTRQQPARRERRRSVADRGAAGINPSHGNYPHLSVFVRVYLWRSNRGWRAAGDAGPKPARRGWRSRRVTDACEKRQLRRYGRLLRSNRAARRLPFLPFLLFAPRAAMAGTSRTTALRRGSRGGCDQSIARRLPTPIRVRRCLSVAFQSWLSGCWRRGRQSSAPRMAIAASD